MPSAVALAKDTVNAVLLYVAKPRFGFVDATSTSYATFVKTNATRKPMLYVGANDGMLHALNATTGVEEWAFIPRQVAPEMRRLADMAMPASTATMSTARRPSWTCGTDRTGAPSWWKGLLRGRGFYALDVTVPGDPKILWEICPDAALCSEVDADMGYSFGNPIIAKRASSKDWVVIVTSGYNNNAPGDGKGYLYVLDAISARCSRR